MNNIQIEKLLYKHPIIKKYFKGALPADKFSAHTIKSDEYYILNLDPSWEPGSHWVSIKLCPEGNNEYFDSYGWPPPYQHFKNILKEYQLNTIQLQHPLTTVCGQYCIFYIWNRICVGTNIQEICNLFSKTNLVENDNAVNSTVEELFNTDLSVIDVSLLYHQISKTLEENEEYYSTLEEKEL